MQRPATKSLLVLLVLLSGAATVDAGTRYPSDVSIRELIAASPYVRYARTIFDLTIHAGKEADRRYPNDLGNNNGPRNAFKHAYWSALLASHVHDVAARNITNAHENKENNPRIEMEMDLHNNNIGIGLGRLNPGARLDLLGDLVQRNVTAGKMRIIKNNKLVWSNK